MTRVPDLRDVAAFDVGLSRIISILIQLVNYIQLKNFFSNYISHDQKRFLKNCITLCNFSNLSWQGTIFLTKRDGMILGGQLMPGVQVRNQSKTQTKPVRGFEIMWKTEGALPRSTALCRFGA